MKDYGVVKYWVLLDVAKEKTRLNTNEHCCGHLTRDLVRDGNVKLVKCAGTQNVLDALNNS